LERRKEKEIDANSVLACSLDQPSEMFPSLWEIARRKLRKDARSCQGVQVYTKPYAIESLVGNIGQNRIGVVLIKLYDLIERADSRRAP